MVNTLKVYKIDFTLTEECFINELFINDQIGLQM